MQPQKCQWHPQQQNLSRPTGQIIEGLSGQPCRMGPQWPVSLTTPAGLGVDIAAAKAFQLYGGGQSGHLLGLWPPGGKQSLARRNPGREIRPDSATLCMRGAQDSLHAHVEL